jgi:hypothetical protein
VARQVVVLELDVRHALREGLGRTRTTGGDCGRWGTCLSNDGGHDTSEQPFDHPTARCSPSERLCQFVEATIFHRTDPFRTVDVTHENMLPLGDASYSGSRTEYDGIGFTLVFGSFGWNCFRAAGIVLTNRGGVNRAERFIRHHPLLHRDAG